MSNPNRADQLNKLYKVLKKHYKPVTPPTRTVMEHLLYACCLENSKYDAADEAFAKVQQSYFDWNEIRVTTIAELAEMMSGLSDPLAAAANFKRGLQGVFESHFAFDIEYLKKQTLGKSEKDLEKYTGGDPFLVAYVAQHGIGGHAIPCGQAELILLHVLGIISDGEVEKKQVPGLERAIPKNKGVEFASLLHQFAAECLTSHFGNRAKSILQEIEPSAKDRIPKRQTKKEIEAQQQAKAKEVAAAKKKLANAMPTPPIPKKPAPNEPAAHAAGKSAKADKPQEKPKEKHSDRGEKHRAAKPAAAESKKTASKHLAKKKPR